MNTTRLYRILASLALLGILSACSSSGNSGGGTPNGTSVGVRGGTVTSTDGNATLVIPAGALDRTVNISIDLYQSQAGDPPAIPGTAYYFNPTGTQFAQPLTLTVSYDPAQLPAGSDETQLRIYKLHPDGTQDFAAGNVDVNANTVTGQIRSFSPRLVGPCQGCDEMNLASAQYNPDRSVTLSWFTAIPLTGYSRIERAKVVGRLTVFESDFVPLADVALISNVAPTFTDRTLGNDAAIYFYRVRWNPTGANSRFLGPPSNIQQVTVFGQVGPPQASFTFTPAAPAVGAPVNFDASGSTDDGTIDNYFWDFEDDGVYDTTGLMPQWSYAAAGTYTVRLRVVDDTGLGTETTRTVAVGQGPFTLTVSVVPQGGFVGSTDGSFSCGSGASNTCAVQYAADTVVDLYAASLPGANLALEAWEGDCAGFGAQTSIGLTLNRDYTCRAVFTSAP